MAKSAEPSRKPGKYEKLGEERHERDLALTRRAGGHPLGFTYDEAAGDRVVQFIERFCRHHKGEWAGQLIKLEPFQKNILRRVFGWLKKDGTRRFRTAYVEIPRKNGKSTLLGGVGIYLEVADREPGAEVYSSATKKDQAAILWKDAAKMVEQSSELKKHVRVYRNSIVCDRMGSVFMPLGADSTTLDGLNPHGNLLDELHAHKDRGVWDVMDTAMGARRQPLTFVITTAGIYDPESIGWQTHEYATKILEGIVEDEEFFAFIAAADDAPDDRTDYYFTETAQRQANPNFGISIKVSYLAKQAEKALNQPSFTNTYLQLHLNRWVQQATRWLSLEAWSKCEVDRPEDLVNFVRERELSLLKRRCFGGLDLSSKLDLTSLELVFPSDDGGFDVISRFWLPENTIKAYAKKGQKHYEQWAKAGWIIPTPGNVIDYAFIQKEIITLADAYGLVELAFDPWSAQGLATDLGNVEGITMVETRQGYKTLSEPSKDLEAYVVDAKLRHMHHPVLRFCASNVVVTRDAAGNIKPDKEKSVQRIDGISALVMAMSRAIVSTPGSNKSYLDDNDMVVLG